MHDRQTSDVIPDDPNDARTSKTRRKAHMHALQEIGERLTALDGERLAQIVLPEMLRNAIVEAGRIRKHGAFRRQLQYIGKLMRTVDTAPIEAKLAEWSGQSREAAAHHHHLEQLRSQLLADDHALGALAGR
ncbi:MAG TPA: ribosome-associated protein, partial [Betaproteobacteria bacterium]|nr:ribosome-associated protein [Betaproteobacteria bacterium]